jgi:hypothetical protein
MKDQKRKTNASFKNTIIIILITHAEYASHGQIKTSKMKLLFITRRKINMVRTKKSTQEAHKRVTSKVHLCMTTKVVTFGRKL